MTDYSKITTQLDAIGYTEDNLENLRIRETVLELFHTLDAQDLTETETNTALDLFSSLADGEKLARVYAVEGSHAPVWTEFKVGETRPGAVVRVRADAYEGAGAKHNRLVGTLVAIRGGRAIVQYSGRNDGVGHTHHPEFLEVLEK